jgi:hypothetical protein
VAGVDGLDPAVTVHLREHARGGDDRVVFVRAVCRVDRHVVEFGGDPSPEPTLGGVAGVDDGVVARLGDHCERTRLRRDGEAVHIRLWVVDLLDLDCGSGGRNPVVCAQLRGERRPSRRGESLGVVDTRREHRRVGPDSTGDQRAQHWPLAGLVCA